MWAMLCWRVFLLPLAAPLSVNQKKIIFLSLWDLSIELKTIATALILLCLSLRLEVNQETVIEWTSSSSTDPTISIKICKYYWNIRLQ